MNPTIAHRLFAPLLLPIALLAGADIARAATASPAPVACVPGTRALDAVMKDMGTLSKTLSAQLSDPARNVDSAARVKQMEALVVESSTLCVPKLERMTDAEAKAAEYAEYGRMMGELRALSQEMGLALSKNDNATAVSLFGKVKELQRAAHARFRS